MHPKPTEIPEEPELKKEKVPSKDFSVHVLDAALKRGLKPNDYDMVDMIFLWDGHYRCNCYKQNHIKDSYFIRFNKDEGILFSEPHLPLALETV